MHLSLLDVDISEVSPDGLQLMAGQQDLHFKTIEKELGVQIRIVRNLLKIEADDPAACQEALEVLKACAAKIENGSEFDRDEIRRLCLLASKRKDLSETYDEGAPLLRTRQGKMIYPKTDHQKELCDAFFNNEIVFATGVAGTGKTYLAVAYAVSLLKKERISKIILTRPAVEAGESLGFLPGDMKEKVDPYLRPLYDALNEMLGEETTARYVEKNIIEIAPLAFMRGRTLNDAVVILDEAQNSTRSQMKMFLTRMGKNTQMIINGDVTQTDLVKKKDSGLIQATEILQGIDGIHIQVLDESDVVRNPLVQKIIERYAEVE